MPSKKTIVDMYAEHVSPGKAEIYRKYDMVLVPGKRGGCYLYDMDGKKYINCHSNGGVFNLGHRNKEVIRAVVAALKEYDIGNHHLISKPKALLAKSLAAVMPKGLNQVVFGVGGGEAIDLAIKLSRGVTGRPEIISAIGGYHGHTGLALATGDRKFKEKFGPPAPGFTQVRFNNIVDLVSAVSDKTAAVIFETIPATMGIVVPEREFFKEVREVCDKNGALLILDEIQTGFGRTGKLWGFEHFGVVPDMVVLGKGMSGGIYPISATVYNEKFAGFFREDPFIHISTFGGSEIGCYAAIETLRLSKRKPFLAHVKRMSGLFKKGFEKLSRKYPSLKLAVRGLGLMMGLEFKDEGTALFMMKILFDRGVYVVYSGNDPRVLQFLPALIVTESQVKEILSCFDDACRALSGIQ